jgi:hypothetical protein
MSTIELTSINTRYSPPIKRQAAEKPVWGDRVIAVSIVVAVLTVIGVSCAGLLGLLNSQYNNPNFVLSPTNLPPPVATVVTVPLSPNAP